MTALPERACPFCALSGSLCRYHRQVFSLDRGRTEPVLPYYRRLESAELLKRLHPKRKPKHHKLCLTTHKGRN